MPSKVKRRTASHLCQPCKEILGTAVGMDDHLTSLIEDSPFECQICKSVYREKFLSCIANQKRIHSERDPYECLYCRKRYSTKKLLKEHLGEQKLKAHAVKGLLRCKICQKVYGYTRPSCHEEEQYPKKNIIYKCSTCLVYFHSAVGMNIHMLHLHSYQTRFICPFCPRVTRKLKYFNKHILKCTEATEETKRRRVERAKESESQEEPNGDFDVRTYTLKRAVCRHSEADRRGQGGQE